MEEVIMPKLGMMIDDVNLVEWFVKEGDEVKEGQEICGIESQKITNQIEVKTSGTVLKILVNEGEKVPIGTVVAIIGDPKEDVS